MPPFALRRWLLFAACAALAPAQIVFNDDTAVRFGDPLAEVGPRLGENSFDVERGRPGVDRLIATTTAELFFDTGRLWRIVLKPSHLHAKPLQPFAEAWMNLGPIDGLAVGYQTTRAQFDRYLAAWKARAAAAGRREGTDYWVHDSPSDSNGDRVTVTIGPRRRLMGTGTLVGSQWHLHFTGSLAARYNPKTPAGSLNEVTASDETYSTLRRERAENQLPDQPRNGHPLADPRALGPTLTFDDGRTVVFGQALADTEWAFGAVAAPANPAVDRDGRLRHLAARGAILEFDSGRLRGIAFGPQHAFAHPVRPFDVAWKNPDPIGPHRLRRGLSTQDLLEYLDAWRERAVAAGKKEQEDFWLLRGTTDTGVTLAIVTLAPQRYALVGAPFHADSFVVIHSPAPPGAPDPTPLLVLHVTLDAFSTAGRPPPGTPDPTLAGVTLEDGTHLRFGQLRAEVERLTGATATIPGGLSPTNTASPRVSLREVSVDFSGDRVRGISYTRWSHPPAPFPEAWKNLDPIGDLQVTRDMTPEQFKAYLAAWEDRAQGLGYARDKHYTVRETSTERSQGFLISLPPSRTSLGGARRMDSWSVSFNPSGPAERRTFRLTGLYSSRGEFSATPPAPNAASARQNLLRDILRNSPQPGIALPELSLPEFTLPKF